MKKLYLIALMATLGLQAGAAVPFQKGKTSAKPRTAFVTATRAPETKTLFEEDFSRFTDGSEQTPAADITSRSNYHIPESMTAQPGWTGRGVHPAGGCVVLMEWPIDDEMSRGGYMSTPPTLLNGTATLTFRAKKYGTEPASIWVALCDDYYGPGDDQEDFPLTDEWQTFTMVATNGSLEELSYFQIMADVGSAFLDDVKVTFRQDRIASPSANNAINLSPTSFKASWEEVPNAEGYLLTVQCTEAPAVVETGEIVESFEGINLSADGKKIDTANPGYPEGWTIDVSTHGSQDATTDASEVASGSKALMFDAVGDVIESADAPLPLDGFSFWAKPIGPEDNYEYLSLIKLELYHSTTGEWEHVANLYYADFEYTDGVYTLNPMTFTNDVTRVRLSMLQEGSKKFFIDDIKMHYRTRGTIKNILEDFRVNATEYDVTDINPANEYLYHVKAFLGDIVSSPSYQIWVDGVVGLKVESNEASEVTPTSFTASWKPLGHATDYTVSLKQVITPTTDIEDVVVLEENFDAITQGTVENPGTDWISPKDFGAEGWASTSWCATQPAWAAGMAGTTGTNAWLGSAGLVFTPALDLSCYDGKGITVEGTFVTTVADLSDFGINESEGVFAMLMNSYTDQQAIAAGLLETPVAGSNSGTITITNVPEDADLSNVIIAFMNKSGMPFFIDDVKITMNVPAGKSLITPLKAVNVQNTSYSFDGLNSDYDHAYQVVGSVTHNYSNYVSEPSEVRIVKTSTAAVADIEIENADAKAEYFNLQGMPVAADALVPGIYIERRGTTTRKVLVR